MKCNCGGPAYVKAKEKQDSASVTMCRACWMAWSFGRTIHSALFVTGIAELPVCDCANIFATTPKEKQVNLEVDVMEGDQFSHTSGYAYHFRESKVRRIGFQYKSDWGNGVFTPDETPIDLPTFTRYCEGCGLTVRTVKPEPQVETIKPPEWAIRWEDGRRELFDNQPSAIHFLVESRRAGRVVRIDWGRA